MIRQKINETKTLALLERVRAMRLAGEDVASFAAGEPDFPTFGPVIEKACSVLRGGQIKYVSTQGIKNFREAVARDYVERLGASWVRAENVLASAGAKQGIYLVLNALLKEGDEVLMPKPYWVSYPSVIKANGGVPVPIKTKFEDDFFPTVENLEKHRTKRTKALIFSSPNNPTGAMISHQRLIEITNWCRKRKVVMIYDELYERLVLDETKKHYCPLALGNEAASEWIISINAFSKSMSMTGWRLGYVVTHKKNIEALTPLQGQMLTSLPGFIQEAAIAGFEQAETLLAPILIEYRKRLDVMLRGVNAIRDVGYLQPAGAFYVFADVSKVMKRKRIRSDADFAARLLEKTKTVVVDGSSMGMPGWIRLSFASSMQEIEKGLLRLKEFCES